MTDAYYLALSVPVVAYGTLLAGIQLGGIPALTSVAHQGSPTRFERGCNEVVTATLVATVALSVTVTAVMIVVIPAAAGGSAHLSSLTRLYMAELLPYAVTGGVAGALGAILAVRGKFAIVTLVLGFEPVLKSVLVLAFGSQLGAQALVLGNVFGNLVAVLVLCVVVRRQGVGLRLVDPRRSLVVRTVFRLSAPLILSQAVLQLNPLIDRTTAASLGHGSVTEMELGLRLFSAPTALLTGIMIAPLAASWSSRLTTEGWPAVVRSFGRVLALVLIFAPPLVAAGVMVRHQLVGFAYSSHAYTPSAVSATAQVLGMLLLGLIPQILTVPLATMFVIRGDTVFPMKVGIANCLINAVLDVTLRAPLGVAGIALSTSLTYTILCGIYVWRARSRWGTLHIKAIAPRLAALSAVSSAGIVAAAAVIVWAIYPAGSRVGELAVMASVAAAGAVIHGAVMTLGRGWAHAGLGLTLSAPWTRGPGIRIGVRETDRP